MAKQNENQKQWAKIVAKAWADEDYKLRLLANPAAVMKKEGLDLPEGVEFKCVEATELQAWVVLPPKQKIGDVVVVGEERLAAAWCACAGCACAS